MLVMPFYKLGKGGIGLFLLHAQQVVHGTARRGQFEFPMHQPAVEFLPLVGGKLFAQLHADAPEVLAVAGLCHLLHNLALVYILFECEQYLLGVDGLYQVVGNF